MARIFSCMISSLFCAPLLVHSLFILFYFLPVTCVVQCRLLHATLVYVICAHITSAKSELIISRHDISPTYKSPEQHEGILSEAPSFFFRKGTFGFSFRRWRLSWNNKILCVVSKPESWGNDINPLLARLSRSPVALRNLEDLRLAFITYMFLTWISLYSRHQRQSRVSRGLLRARGP